MRFVSEGVCVMRHCGPMCYAVQFPSHRLGGQTELCVIRGYALSEVCVKRSSTVASFFGSARRGATRAWTEQNSVRRETISNVIDYVTDRIPTNIFNPFKT